MKKVIKEMLLIILVLICSINTNVSRASFADFSDEDAERKTENMINEQKNMYDATKSNNNYLKELRIEGFELTPEFDKQTLEYYIDIPENVKEITIDAKADDNNAELIGSGKVVIKEDQSECRIDVIAQSGTVRTYTIRINGKEKNVEDSQEIQENFLNEKEKTVNYDTDKSSELTSNENQKKIKETAIMLVLIAGVIIVVIIIIVFKKKNNTKHKAKRRKV